MIFSSLIHKSIDFAIQVHRTQKRKGKDVPYITHSLAVGLILSRVTQDENIICAGILHDTIEDCKPYGTVTRKILEKEFNTEIARMVDDVTEQDKSLPWKERKKLALEHIKYMKQDALLVKSADALHNLTELNDDTTKLGDKAFESFNASKEDTILRYEKLIVTLEETWVDNPLLGDLKVAHTNLLSLLSK